jgi:hypothetical protein
VSVQLREYKQSGAAAANAAVTSLVVPTTTGWYQVQVGYTTIGAGNKLQMSVFSTNTSGGGASYEVDDCTLTSHT